MATCKRDPNHIYPPHNKTCPWCAIANLPPAEAASRSAQQTARAQSSIAAQRPANMSQATAPAPVHTKAPLSSASVLPRNAGAEKFAFGHTVSEFLWFGVILAFVCTVTPVVASFGTAVFGDRLGVVVFMNGESGSTSGDGPWTLYLMLLRGATGVWVVCLAARLIVERKSSRIRPFLVGSVGAGVGLILFLFQLVQDALVPESWYWTPAGFALGYLAASILTFWSGRRGIGGASAADPKVPARIASDWVVVGVAIGLSVTVIVPWLLGRFVLRDRLGREASSEVFDTAARSAAIYFKSDWFAGASVVLILACLFVLFRPWHGRIVSLISAGAIITAVFMFLLPVAEDEWEQAEAATVVRLSAEAYPFYDNYVDCGGEEVSFTREDGSTETWALYLARFASASADVRCDHAVLYKGWRKVANIDFPKGSYEYYGGLCCESEIEVRKGKSRDKARFVVTFGNKKSMTVRLHDYLKE